MTEAAGWLICNRSARRVALFERQGSLMLDTEEGLRAFPLIDLSLVGLAFRIGDAEPGLEVGSVRTVVVRVGAEEIRGTIQIVRLSRESGAGRICGANLDLAGDADRRALSNLLKQLEACLRPA